MQVNRSGSTGVGRQVLFLPTGVVPSGAEKSRYSGVTVLCRTISVLLLNSNVFVEY